MLDHYAPGEQVNLVGHSMGTCEMTRYLAVHGSERVARAVYLGAMTPYFAGAVGSEAVEGTVADLRADRPNFLARFWGLVPEPVVIPLRVFVM